MFILARGGQVYARLRFRAGPRGSLEIAVKVDYQRPFPTADHAAWQQEYGKSVQVAESLVGPDWDNPLDFWDADLAKAAKAASGEAAGPA